MPNKKISYIILIFLLFLPILLLLCIDYLNIESFTVKFNENFVFEWTWKGRMFYLFFLWLVIMEFHASSEIIRSANPTHWWASLICLSLPTVYVLAVNFFGLNTVILWLGETFGISKWGTDFIFFHWPLSCEYMVFAVSFIMGVTLSYGKTGLQTFSISLSFLASIASAYMFDTIFPFGVFKPLQVFALPTAATSAALFELLGYTTQLRYPVRYGESNLPLLVVTKDGKMASVGIAWACAGVHSLLLYTLIILVFFKKLAISKQSKIIYFLVGFIGTYFVNVLRVFSLVLVMLNYGQEAMKAAHDIYGELFFLSWIFVYMFLILSIEEYRLVEQIRSLKTKIFTLISKIKGKLMNRIKASK